MFFLNYVILKMIFEVRVVGANAKFIMTNDLVTGTSFFITHIALYLKKILS